MRRKTEKEKFISLNSVETHDRSSSSYFWDIPPYPWINETKYKCLKSFLESCFHWSKSILWNVIYITRFCLNQSINSVRKKLILFLFRLVFFPVRMILAVLFYWTCAHWPWVLRLLAVSCQRLSHVTPLSQPRSHKSSQLLLITNRLSPFRYDFYFPTFY